MIRSSLLWCGFSILTGCTNEPGPTEDASPPAAVTSYSYHFEEATGSPQWIMMDSKLIEFVLDQKRSEPEALATFMALEAEVLYPNADGNITLQGSLDSDGKTFVLQHWYLKPDFVRLRFPETVGKETFESKPGKLTPDDFNINLKAKAPHFFEQKYLQPLKGETSQTRRD